MSNTEVRPFAAATNKFAYAQAFSRTSLPSGHAVDGKLRTVLQQRVERRKARRLVAH